MENSGIMFREITIGSMAVKNRFVFAAAQDHLDSDPGRRAGRFGSLASGGVGLVISGATDFADIEGWRGAIEAVHKNGGKIAPQIIPDKIKDALPSVVPPECPFFGPALYPYREHRPYTEEEILGFISQYAARAEIAKSLGADGVEIHGAHHAIPMCFLSPLTNRRDDRWGGPLENRLRFHRELLSAVRARVGAEFPVMLKLGVEDAIPGGFRLEEGREAARILSEAGFDAIEVSQGLMNSSLGFEGTPLRPDIRKPEQEAYFRSWSRAVKAEVKKPVIVTGGIFSIETVESVIGSGDADMVSMCRALLREPGLVDRWKSGDTHRATCISCNKCTTELLLKGQPLECFLDLKKSHA
ncbi:MAG: NADH:flavin oxidoreductase [Candidatus Eremiobacteraeota bacterium]|nr:NADH:flavin oxidoreductase [Candidatus Eremiobacteraeota bacterium]